MGMSAVKSELCTTAYRIVIKQVKLFPTVVIPG